MPAYCGPELAVDGVLMGLGVGGGGGEGLVQALHFQVADLGLDEALGNAIPLGIQDQGWTDGDTGRDGDAAFDFHATATGEEPTQESGVRSQESVTDS